MSIYLVLVSQHKFFEEVTTHFNLYTKADTKLIARDNVQRKYSPWYQDRGSGLVAYFTGAIYKLV